MMRWILLAVLVVNAYVLPVKVQGWTIIRACVAEETATPADFVLDGAIFAMQPDDGFKAYRFNPGTFYYIAFSGSNFVHAGALSPDGSHYAVPYGTIQTPLAGDTRYRVQEIRVFTTDRVPQITRFIGWSATFQVGGFGDIPTIRWLDDETVLYSQGSVVNGDLTSATIRPFDADSTPVESIFDASTTLSPDVSRTIAMRQGETALVDVESSQTIVELPDGINQLVWSGDSQQFAVSISEGITNKLLLYSRDGVLLDTVLKTDAETVIRNVRWSPDGQQLAFSLFDPQSAENALYLADVDAKTLRDTCLLLDTLYLGGRDGGGVVWSPDSTHLAILSTEADYGFTQIVNLSSNTRYGLTGYNGGLIDWK